MQLPIKAICDRRTNKNGTNLISIQYCYSSERRTTIPTSIYVPYHYWNKKQRVVSKKIPSSQGNHVNINNALARMLRRAEDLVLLAKEVGNVDPVLFLKTNFNSKVPVEELKKKMIGINKEPAKLSCERDIYFQLNEYINSKISKVSKSMPRIYKNMKYHLEAFEKFRGTAITFDCLDFNFYENFVDFLSNHYIQNRRKNLIVGLKVNTVGKTIKQLRTFLRDRIRKKIIDPIDMEGWTILEEEVDAVYLPFQQIKLITECDLGRFPHLEYYRNDFVLGCLTGLRFSDFSKLMRDDVKGDMLYKKQQKSNHWVVIPLKPAAKQILIKRFSEPEKCRTNAEYNRHIKTIAMLAGINEKIKFSYKKSNVVVTEVKPKYEWITTHTCRRSFCTNEFLLGTPVELIMKISGHKSIKDFYKYIRITPEEAGLKIKEIWLKRGDMDFCN